MRVRFSYFKGSHAVLVNDTLLQKCRMLSPSTSVGKIRLVQSWSDWSVWHWFVSHLTQPPKLSHPSTWTRTPCVYLMRIPPSPIAGPLGGFVALGCSPKRRGVITPSQQASVYFLWKHSEVGVSGMRTSVRARTSKANMLQIWPPAYLRPGLVFFFAP